jgi:outer membrane lipoprotein-sorting protein
MKDFILKAALALSLALAAMGLPTAAAAPAFGLGELTALLAQVKSGQATFTEKRQVAVLDRVLESSGRLSFEAPDTFVRETLEPKRERLAVVGNTLTMSRGDRSRTMALDASPEAGAIVEAIRGTLTGNRQTLERHFNATVEGSAERWQLLLLPREMRLRSQVMSFRITGRQALLSEIEVTMADGDVSVMRIETVVPAASAASAPASAPR